MNIAVIFAGGTGTRMNTKSRPKQFLEMHGKPVLIYTLEHFQNHPQIDHIILVSLAAWLDYAAELVKKFSITKVSAIVPGGSTGQESIYHGIKKAHELYGDKNIVFGKLDAALWTKTLYCRRPRRKHQNYNTRGFLYL